MTETPTPYDVKQPERWRELREVHRGSALLPLPAPKEEMSDSGERAEAIRESKESM